MRLGIVAAVAICAAGEVRADPPPQLAMPVDCSLGEDCFIQNYADMDASGAAHDFRCGPLSYDGHKGTDFRLRNLAAMREGVDVVAAAAGRVARTRDGEPDVDVHDRGPERVRGRECGNGVIIEHGPGWQTRYCHMKRDSIAVRPGDKVAAGAMLGQIGLSGYTEFPHLHFEVRHNGRPIDPFTGSELGRGCAADAPPPLWAPAIRETLTYRPSGVLNAGFTAGSPTRADIDAAAVEPEPLARDAPAIVFWIEIFGLRRGDVETRRLLGPSGEVLVETKPRRSDRNRATFFGFVGKRRTAEAWPRGRYVGEFQLRRDHHGRQEVILQVRREIVVR